MPDYGRRNDRNYQPLPSDIAYRPIPSDIAYNEPNVSKEKLWREGRL